MVEKRYWNDDCIIRDKGLVQCLENSACQPNHNDCAIYQEYSRINFLEIITPILNEKWNILNIYNFK